MRYPAAEKAEIILLIEQSHMAPKRTPDTLGMVNLAYNMLCFVWLCEQYTAA